MSSVQLSWLDFWLGLTFWVVGTFLVYLFYGLEHISKTHKNILKILCFIIILGIIVIIAFAKG